MNKVGRPKTYVTEEDRLNAPKQSRMKYVSNKK